MDPDDPVATDVGDHAGEPASSSEVDGDVEGARLDGSLAGAGLVERVDPLGDGAEQPGSVPNVHDQDASTSWTTDSYKTAALSGLKPGVGLVVDLGRPTAVGRVELAMAAAGGTVEVRVVKPTAIGWVVVFKMRPKGEPSYKVLCLPVGATKPTAC